MKKTDKEDLLFGEKTDLIGEKSPIVAVKTEVNFNNKTSYPGVTQLKEVKFI